MHPVLGAAGPRHPRVQERLVLEEIHVPPRLGLGVVHRAGTLIAARHRTPETGAPREVQVQIQSACATSKSERVTRHGSANPKAALNRSRVSDIRPIPQHPATERHNPSWPTPRTPGGDTAKPTRSGEEPNLATSRSMTQSFFQHRCRHVATASSALRRGRYP